MRLPGWSRYCSELLYMLPRAVIVVRVDSCKEIVLPDLHTRPEQRGGYAAVFANTALERLNDDP